MWKGPRDETATKDLASTHFSDQSIAQIIEKEIGESSSFDPVGLEPSPLFHSRWGWSEKTSRNFHNTEEQKLKVKPTSMM